MTTKVTIGGKKIDRIFKPKYSNITHCIWCGNILSEHIRCNICNMLLHLNILKGRNPNWDGVSTCCTHCDSDKNQSFANLYW